MMAIAATRPAANRSTVVARVLRIAWCVRLDRRERPRPSHWPWAQGADGA
jgi:hypothetical protein